MRDSAGGSSGDRETAGLVIVGGGGHARVVAEAAAAMGLRVSGFLDDSLESRMTGEAPRLGALSMLAHADLVKRYALILGLGDIPLRRRLIAEIDGMLATIIHPTAYISPTAEIGGGVFIGPHAIVHAGAHVGDHGSVNSGAVVEHDCIIGVNSHVGPGAVLGGNVRVGEDTLVGLGSRVLPGVTIGNHCVVGAGAAVVAEVEDGSLVVGVPARALER